MNDREHADATNPCQGVCVIDSGHCIACCRTAEEREQWYDQTNQWREETLEKISQRHSDLFED